MKLFAVKWNAATGPVWLRRTETPEAFDPQNGYTWCVQFSPLCLFKKGDIPECSYREKCEIIEYILREASNVPLEKADKKLFKPIKVEFGRKLKF